MNGSSRTAAVVSTERSDNFVLCDTDNHFLRERTCASPDRIPRRSTQSSSDVPRLEALVRRLIRGADALVSSGQSVSESSDHGT